MNARILDGRALATTLREELAGEVQQFRHQVGYGPTLAIVRVGNDPASVNYARQIDKTFQAVGFGYELQVLPVEVTQEELIALLEQLGRDHTVQGVLLQRPLPATLNADVVMARFPVVKDVEGITPLNLGNLLLNSGNYYPTSTPSAGITLLKRYGIPIQGRHAVVVGRSIILGRPLSLLLLHEHATVTTCHSRTPDLATYTRQADILLAAAGRAGIITGPMVKPGATVVDFGVNFTPDGRMVGDVDFASVHEVAGVLTPVPGGTGPVTTVMLMRNTLEAARKQTARVERRTAKER